MTGAQFVLYAIAGIVAFAILRPLLLGGRRVKPAEAAAAVEAGTAVLVDVREPGEWKRGVARPAALLPLSDFRGERRQWTPFLEANRGREILLYCASGIRSGTAAAALKREGFAARNLGGFARWTDAGLPVRKP